MGDEEGRKYTWLSLEATPEGADAPAERGFVAGAGRARASYPNGDVYEGGFNEALQKHGRGTYTWSTAPGSNPFVPEGDGYPGASPRREEQDAPLV